MPKLEPYGNRILVRPDEAIEQTQSGIIIPDKARKLPSHGKVVAIGKGDFDRFETPFSEFKWPDGSWVVPQVGATVWFNKFAGTDLKFQGEDLIIMHISDVIGVEHDA